MLHSESSEVLQRRCAGFGLEDVGEPPGREIYRPRQVIQRQRLVKINLHEFDDTLHSAVHVGRRPRANSLPSMALVIESDVLQG